LNNFSFLSPSHFILKNGAIENLPYLIKNHGSRIVFITGGKSLEESGQRERITQLLKSHSIEWQAFSVDSEPNPEEIDNIVSLSRKMNPNLVLAIGGGSVMDAGKAVSAMLAVSGSVEEYLEGVGSKDTEGKKLPFIAIPTTSGTGSEATKNAVISRIGSDGYKKSLRHDNFIPDYAVIDPSLMLSCPAEVTAASGMDALSQLLESYLSLQANPITDALAKSGLEALASSFPQVCREKASSINARADMAYASYCSGLCLANAGLGTVHGIAGVMGGFVQVPHGKACGTLLAPVMKKTLELGSGNIELWWKMATAGRILTGESGTDEEISLHLLDKLQSLSEETGMTNFKSLKMDLSLINKISEKSGNKNNPEKLSRNDIREILTSIC